jgi:hypothetical protein
MRGATAANLRASSEVYKPQRPGLMPRATII